MWAGQIKALVSMIDTNKGNNTYADGEIEENEYAVWYKLFIVPWELCDTDKDNFLTALEIRPCLNTPALAPISTIADSDIP